MGRMNCGDILIWDSIDEVVTNSASDTLLWSGFEEDLSSSVISIPKIVESHAEEFRAQYLSWIYELGEKKYRNRRVVDHLQLHPGFSYWWMSLITEKSNFSKSPQINNAIKLLALQRWLVGREITRLELVSGNAELSTVLKVWCDNNGIRFFWKRIINTDTKQPTIFRLRYRYLPLPLQAIFWLTYRLVTRWHLAGVGVTQWRQSHADTAFVSYLDNLVPEVVEQGEYESHYWGNLPNSLASDGLSSRWLHIWAKDKVVPTVKVAKKMVERFNRTKDTKQVHVTLDSFLGIHTVWNTLVAWLGLQWKARKIESELSKHNGATFNMWPLLRNDWLNSIKGPTSMNNLLMFNLFEAAFVDIPELKQGCYLQEKQNWEIGFIAAWRHANHNELIGVLHSTIRFWDLRHFFDVRNYQRTDTLNLLLPSKVAANGPVAKMLYLEGGYPSDQIVDVEALRYLYLENTVQKTPSIQTGKDSIKRLLVLTDYSPKITKKQMELLENVAQVVLGWEIVIKPHPNCPVSLELYPQLKALGAIVTDKVISKMLVDYNVAYTSPVTSAAVDAYCAGLQVISVLDPATLHLGPLRDISCVNYIGTSEELLDALISLDKHCDNQNPPPDYFALDQDIPKWKQLLLH